MPTSPSVFRAGVVAVTAGSPIVLGTGTGFLLNGVTGGMFSLAGHAVPVLSADSETQLTLAYDWPGATASGVADYAISLESALAADATFVHNRLVSVLDAIGAIENARPNYEVLSVGSNAPPGSPVVGGLYVVGTVPNGAWVGQANNLAQWTGAAWLFTAPERGTTVVSAATGIVSIWNGTTWGAYVAPSSFIATLMDDASASAALSTLGVSDFAKTILDDTTAAEARTTLGATAFRALGTLTGAAGSFARFTGAGGADAVMQAIVGTVSQSAGVPTGAIVEAGSNGNGNYVKFADGTMVCWATFAVRAINIASSAVIGGFRSAAIIPTFPIAFAAVPAIVTFATGGSGASGSAITACDSSAPTTGNFSFYLAASVNTTAAGAGYVAIGRWY
ncbi:hypothetical protein Snov_0030 [Ancylobacter novellus DSM 506]|uniref:DUF2793 domain-containing protein n=1 Tax=Ancylobacter novellus (strain ATCC 8093 / DSM 506 / JCM 20403 / CCM 1077 / IAM 12100 / NBRC 12443 / NCIMB 10456) TaxID=639283 RepID=D6ZZV3_ANCN5|nr:DUF2793 domain-containing protein [Ancylobacter novellus]ADH87367.1 hypothetical protein Snov_0030 [Ancylobacter novellus DSM 506]